MHYQRSKCMKVLVHNPSAFQVQVLGRKTWSNMKSSLNTAHWILFFFLFIFRSEQRVSPNAFSGSNLKTHWAKRLWEKRTVSSVRCLMNFSHYQRC
jgi:hypothetical protein